MKTLSYRVLFSLVISLMSFWLYCQENKVIRLHPENNHYFLFRDKPTVLITSAEHYGAVMNKDFNYKLYLETLRKEGFNYTRIFIGPYSETGSDQFGISNNAMDTKEGSWITPWVKDPVTQKYDLEKWNPDFFIRLKDFVKLASEKDIVVEVTLFTSYYVNKHWKISPFYFRNNVQAMDSIPFVLANTLYNGKLLEFEERYVNKVVHELNAFENFFFEIQNEPWSDNPNLATFKKETDRKNMNFSWQMKVELANDVSLEWQHKIADVIQQGEENLPNKHLIAQNFCNFGIVIANPNPAISVFNFHYAGPGAAYGNMQHKAVMGLDETGFMPHNDFIYRRQAWNFILAGGALYNNLDYSFITGTEDGTQIIDNRTPGWGGPGLRKQFRILKDFIEGFDFIHMTPNPTLIDVPGGETEIQMMAWDGYQYGAYLENNSISLWNVRVPDAEYIIDWTDPLTGNRIKTEILRAKNNRLELKVPGFKEDIALRIIRNPVSITQQHQEKEGDHGISILIRGDDIGSSHAANVACIESYRRGIMRSTEIMVPCAWFPEAVKLLNENPGLDVGVHLVVTSEWEGVKWRPLTWCPSLTDQDGYFYPTIWPGDSRPKGTSLKEANWKIKEIEGEFRVQIELAKKHIPWISHIDCHMGCGSCAPEVEALIKKLAEEYNLDINPGEFGYQRLRLWGENDSTAAQRISATLGVLKNLKPGKYIFVDHPGLNTPELQATGHPGYENVAADRDAVTRVFTSKAVMDVIRERNISLVNYREAADLKPHSFNDFLLQ